MPTASIVILIIMVAALALIYLAWSSGRKALPPKSSKNDMPEVSRPAPDPSPLPTPLPTEASEPVTNVPDLSITTLERDRDSDPEITMVGKVPEEVLALMQGKLSADAPIEVEEEEESYDIDVEELVDALSPEEITGKHALFLVVGVARSDRGRRRKCNEDAFLILESEHLFAVADGMGGHNAGEVASQAVVDAMAECFRTRVFPGGARPDWPRRGDELVRTIHHANHVVYGLAQKKEEYTGMGTTVVAVRFSPNKQRAYIAHVGDSRCYRIRADELHQLTEDHTLGRLMGAKGKAARHLAQAVGVRPDVAVDLTVDEPKPGDLYMVCSDGLTKMVPDDRLLDLILKDGDLEARCHELIAEANDCGGRDNITVIMIRVENPFQALKQAGV